MVRALGVRFYMVGSACSNPAKDFFFQDFFQFFAIFKCLYHFFLNDLKHETFTLERRGSKVSLVTMVDHGPLRPFEKNSIEIWVFMK